MCGCEYEDVYVYVYVYEDEDEDVYVYDDDEGSSVSWRDLVVVRRQRCDRRQLDMEG